MKPDLVLVANAADARLYTRDAGDRKLHLLDTLASPQSRLQPRDLASKPLGHERSSRRTEGVLFTPRIDAQRKRHLAFARQLAQRIDAALQTHAYDGVVLFAAWSPLPPQGAASARRQCGINAALRSLLSGWW